ncbi:ribulose-phosphate 3-epimerase [candidate division KSB3 bacterium]|uniref:Ribulose-phosphate 3-epimerase n=1 Tax=candidate division KSB3 bacterium TaxID=2044937 RepID=A0A9D5JYC1_9BACT|nr:ribulose-phosphate 3-epimerase [candidate division KSB3 bacterium]MBD3326498.1 ribulose-phosphate 3-epimerase [candidate division KSB3 bacterium]
MIKISPSLMCADLLNLHRDIETLLRVGVDQFHLDVMDGHFVRNFGLCYDLIKQIRATTQLPLEVHLTIDNPESHIDLAAEAGADIITIHPDVTPNLDAAVRQIIDRGKGACLAIAPRTPLHVLDDLLEHLTLINLMAVNPGFAGQKASPDTFDKIRQLRETLTAAGSQIPIQIDGNTSYDNIPAMINNGADILVLGTSSLFRQQLPLGESLKAVKTYIQNMAV